MTTRPDFDEAGQITILTCSPGNVAAKTHSRGSTGGIKTTPIGVGKYFIAEELQVNDINELHALLLRTGKSSDKFIIRGHTNPAAPVRPDGRVRRACRPSRDEREEFSWFLEQPRCWAMLDFDKVENPEGIDPTSEEAMASLRRRLPPEFHNVTCSYSLSSSAGLTCSNRISGHLWFYLDRPVGQQALKSWLAEYKVDKALFGTVQPHFVASPIFRDGIENPVAQRKGLLRGSRDVVAVPEIDIRKPIYAGRRGEGAGLQAAHGYQAKMSLLGDGEAGQGCHAVITSAIAAYISQHGPNCDREALKADIRLRAAVAPWDRAKHSLDYVAHEVSDEVLDRSIQDWIDKAFTWDEGYAISEKDDVETARGKVIRATDHWFVAATQWQAQHDYRRAMAEGRLRSYVAADGTMMTACDGEPGSSFFGASEEAVRAFCPPPRHGVDAQVALGKTEAYLSLIPKLIPTLRSGHCILIVVPNHRLSRELLKRTNDHGFDAEVYLGPAQDDPAQAGKTMCWIPEQLAEFQAAGIAKSLCDVCPHRQSCGFQVQRRKKAQVWIAAHQVIFRKRGLPIPPVDYLIVDEDPLAAGLEGDNPQQKPALCSDQVPDEMRQAMERLALGVPLERSDFGMTDRRLRELAREVYYRIRKVELPEAPTLAEIEAAAELASLNIELVDEAALYRSIADSGPWGMRACGLDGGVVGLRWLRQRRIHRDFEVPTLFLDATARWDATRYLFDCDQSPVGYRGEPFLDEDGSISIYYAYPQDPIIGPITAARARTPYVSYRQVLFSGAAASFKYETSGQGNVARVRRYIEARSVGRKQVLVICQLDLEKKLVELGLPPNVEVAHFNSVRGRDEWKSVDLLIMIGRTQPPPAAMELHAEALFRAPVMTLGPEYYDKVWVSLTGTAEQVAAERHPEPLAELMRWRVCEAELIQAIGRGRGVNRTGDDPLQVDLINMVPLPDIEIDEVLSWDDAQPDAGDVIAGRYGPRLPAEITKGTANVVAALLPDQFGTPNAARQAGVYSRAGLANRDSLIAKPAREYTFAPVALKAPGCRYAVLAQALRPPIRRPLGPDEVAPAGADVTDDGVLAYGPVHVLRDIPRKLL